MPNPETVLSFRSDHALKRDALSLAAEHRAADRLVHGAYFAGNQRGCSVGCFARDLYGADGDEDIHQRTADALGLPVWVLRLQDHTFESLPLEQSRDFHVELFDAIPVGVDLDPALRSHLLFLLTDPEYGARRAVEDDRWSEQREPLDEVADAIRSGVAWGDERMVRASWRAAGAA